MGAALGDFYAGKRVLVTGHTGFKGGWLARWLGRMGAQVSGFALEPDQHPSLFELARIGSDMSSVIADVRDFDALKRVVDEQEPEIVFHLAAQSLVRRSYREPIETYSTNVMGTVHLLDACRSASSVRAVVIVTSDKCYENREWVWGYRENEPLGGHDPYSSSKGAAEIVTAAYRRSFFAEKGGAGIASARAGNVIGGGDWSEDRLLPDIVRGASAGTQTIIRNPGSTRPWQHVLEPLSGYLLLARRLFEEPERYAQAYNFGPSSEGVTSAGEVSERFVAQLGRGKLSMPPRDPSAPHEARFLALDCSKARAELDWRPRLDLDATLAMTAEWYRAHFESPGSERDVTDRQIEEYERRSA